MVDVHSHILPGLDDGVRSMDDAVLVVEVLAKLGFTQIVATPHFYPGRYTPGVEVIETALSGLRTALSGKSIPVEILRGRECLLDYELLTAPERDTFPFSVAGKKYQLIEFQQMTLPASASSYLKTLRAKGVQPILAHAERYNRIIRNPDEIHDFIEMGFLIQVDIRSFSTQAHKAIRKAAYRLLETDCVHLVATDVHSPSQLDEIADAMTVLHKETNAARFQKFFELS